MPFVHLTATSAIVISESEAKSLGEWEFLEKSCKMKGVFIAFSSY